MKTQISTEPAKQAGSYIRDLLLQHAQEPVLFLISGGSAFDILSHINNDALASNVTLALVDDRFTNDAQGSNYLQFTASVFYQNAAEKGIRMLSSVPREGERHEQFAERINDAFTTHFTENTNPYVLGIFGVGEDGHTASIFPAPEVNFEEAYNAEVFTVAITQTRAPYPLRITITPFFIEEYINDVVLYAVGSKKCDNILSYMHTKNFGRNEIPALIPARHPNSILFTDCQALL